MPDSGEQSQANNSATSDEVAEVKPSRTSPDADDASGDNVTAREFKDELNAIRRIRRKFEDEHARIETEKTQVLKSLATVKDKAGTIESVLASVKHAQDTVHEHSTKIAESAGEAKATADSINSMHETVETHASRIETVGNLAKTAQAQCASIAEKSKSAEQNESKIEAACKSVEKHASEAEKSLQIIQNDLELTTSDRESSVELLGEIRKSKASVEALVKQLKEADEISKAHAVALEHYKSECGSTLGRINELLPGATSAGLAAAFESRANKFKWPMRLWTGGYVLSVLGLTGLAVWGFVDYSGLEQGKPYDLLLIMLARLPFALPLIWLALHASHRAGLSRRLEEDYAYKATVARSFEGYRRQMEEVGSDLDSDSPLNHLCANTLRSMSMLPGRIYESKHREVTPGTAVSDMANRMVKGRRIRATTPAGSLEVENTESQDS